MKINFEMLLKLAQIAIATMGVAFIPWVASVQQSLTDLKITAARQEERIIRLSDEVKRLQDGLK